MIINENGDSIEEIFGEDHKALMHALFDNNNCIKRGELYKEVISEIKKHYKDNTEISNKDCALFIAGNLTQMFEDNGTLLKTK